MMLYPIMFSLNKVDRVFLIIIIVAIAIGIGIYFLIPVLNRKQYQQMRENLAKREAAFKSNLHVDFSKVNNENAPQKEELDNPQENSEPKEE